ncbi:hypothetical protein SUGI_0314520 [Cryptomeria japonica]|nr:hypothetical protein SUGI_0314520 [Cryptomeria japonica]
MDRRGSMLIRSSRVKTIWKPTKEQKKLLRAIYMSGNKRPTAEQMEEIMFNLQRCGFVREKDVRDWFHNSRVKEEESKIKAVGCSSIFIPWKWFNRSKNSSAKKGVEEHVAVSVRRNPSV